MSEPPEVLDAGEEFMIISEVQPLCLADELPRVPAFERPSLVDSVPLFGLILVAKGGTLVVKSSRTVLSSSSGSDGGGSEVWCGGRITHITHACDDLTVFVITIWGDNCPHLLCFDTAALLQQGSSARPYLECSNSRNVGSRVLGLAVNPTDPACLAYCTSTGDLTVITISSNSVTYNTKRSMGARALGWSAKGKQMCVGCEDGSLSLHKPDLTPVRAIASPPFFTAAPVTALVWFTNTEFFVAYQQSNNQPCLVYVNGPKGQPAQYINYEDVCYSNDSAEPLFYHLLFIPQWNQLLVLSSGGIEMATLIKTASGGWAQLALEEGSRAEMHFINVTQETFPLGMTLDLSSTKTFTVREDVTEGPYPAVVSLSTGGELNIFHLINKLPDKPDLRDSLPAQASPAGPVRTAQQYCSNILIPPPSNDSSAPSVVFTAADAGTSSSTGPAISGFAFSSSFTAPNSSAGFTAAGSTTLPAVSATNSSVFASTNTFVAPDSAASSTSSFLSGVSTIASASTTGASTLFSTLSTTSAGGGTGLFSRAAVPPSSGSSLFGGASLFSQTKTPPYSLFGGGAALVGAAPAASQAAIGSSSSPTPTTAFSFAGGSSAFSVPVQSSGGSSLFKAPSATVRSATTDRAAAPEAVSPPAEISLPAALADGAVSAAGRTPTAGKNYRPPASPALQGAPSVSSSRASPSVGEHQQLAPAGGRSARSAAQEAALLAQTLKEQDLFEAELQEHLALCARSEYKGGWKASMEAVQSALQKLQASLDHQQQQVGDISEGVTALHHDSLEFYSAFEATKATVQQLKEPRCNQLSEWRGLARSSERQLQQLRDQVHYIQRELNYASAALDSLPTCRGRPDPHSRSSATTVYRAAQLSRSARVSCETRLDQLSSKLKQLSVTGDLAFSKKEDKKTAKTGRYGISEESLLVEEKENLNGGMTQDKQQQLWAILQRRGDTPVRKSGEAVLSPYVAGNGSPRQPRQLHEPSFLSLSFGPGQCSTPIVGEGASRQAPDSSAAGKQGLLDTPKSSWPTASLPSVKSASVKVEPAETAAAKYEDITPPGTPEVDSRAQEDNRAVSSHPLSALSSLVGKVPPTATVGMVPQGSLTQPPDTPKSSNAGFSFGAFAPPKSDLKFVSNLEKDGIPFFAASPSTFSSSFSTGTSTIVTTMAMNFSTGAGISVTSSTAPGVTSRPFNSSSGSGSIFGGTLVQPGVVAACSSGGAAAGLDLTTTSVASSRSSESAITNSDFFTRGSVTITPVNKPSYYADQVPASEIGNISVAVVRADDDSDKITAGGLVASETNSSSTALPKQALISVVSPNNLFPTSTTATLFLSRTPTSANSSLSVVQSSAGVGTSLVSTFTVPPTSEVHEAPTSGLFGATKAFGSGSMFAVSARAVTVSTENATAAPGTSTPSATTSANAIFADDVSIFAVGGLVSTPSASTLTIAPSASAAASTFGMPAVLGSEAAPGSAALSFATKTSGLPGASLFSTPASTNASLFATSVPSSTSIFGAPASSSSVLSITGSSSAALFSTSSNTSSASSVFGTTPSSVSVFGAPISSSVSMFGASVSSSSVFGAPVSSSSVVEKPVSSSSSDFETPTIPSSSSIFENPVSSSSSVFGTPATSSNSIFGTPAASCSSVFGTAVTSSNSVFGTPATSSSSVFGTAVTSSNSVFGNPATSSSSVFGTAVTSSNSVFGTPATSSSSVFGTAVTSSSSVLGIAVTSSSSVFGTPATSSASVFGAPASSSSSVFGAPSTSTSSMFGSLPSSGTVFGAPTFSSAGSVFGVPASTAASVFGSVPSSGSLFVTPAVSSASTFGGSGSIFGAPTSSSSSVFGTTSAFGTAASSTQSSMFGSSSAFGGKPTQTAGGPGSAFGPSSSVFGGGAAPTSSASMFGGGGQAGAFGSTGSNAGGGMFGGGAAPFTSQSSSSLFGCAAGGGGGSSSSTFAGSAYVTRLGLAAPLNSPNENIFGLSGSAVKPQTDLFGGPGSGSATVSAAPSLFGGSSNSALSKPASAFGAAPAFGSPPKFGSAPAFGSPPAFGGSVFGGASAPVSGSGSTAGGGFSSFANSSGAATFGGLAATGSSNNNSFGTGESSPFTSGSIGGGSSFTSWR